MEVIGETGANRRQDTDATEGELSGPFDDVVLEGLQHDRKTGNKGWEGLQVAPQNEDDLIALPFTSGTTSRPKGVMYTHRGAYLAALANLVESGLNVDGRCKYLWTLPMQGPHLCLVFRAVLPIFHLLTCLGFMLWAGHSHGPYAPSEARITASARSTILSSGNS